MSDRISTVLVIAGPTASGKTRLAIELARKFKTEIISADSRQMYKELSIGVARPEKEDLQTVPHHFIGNLSITDYYSASMFEMDVLALLPTLFEKNRFVVMAGGSGLYINSVCNGIDDLPTIDPGVRETLLKRYRSEGLESLRLQLKILDPVYYQQADLHNPKRVLKALEVSIQTGKPYSSFLTGTRKKRNFRILKLGINPQREILYQRIEQRTLGMIEAGLLEEVKNLLPYKHLNALNTVGYKEIFEYLDGQIPVEEALRLIIRNTRHYAKRQISWFQRDKEYQWFPSGDTELIFPWLRSNFE